MIVGPTKVLFMDEISTGLDSSTTFQIVKCLQQIVHLGEATILMSLLQPAPETFDLFDDIILLSEGQIVYQGPREYVLEFFDSCGFCCPERKGTADFLQEVPFGTCLVTIYPLKAKFMNCNKTTDSLGAFPGNIKEGPGAVLGGQADALQIRFGARICAAV
jgi:ABC-type multidrug transport system ATPase subunit